MAIEGALLKGWERRSTLNCSDQDATISRNRIVTGRRRRLKANQQENTDQISFKEIASRDVPLRRPTTTLSEKLVESKIWRQREVGRGRRDSTEDEEEDERAKRDGERMEEDGRRRRGPSKVLRW